MKKQSFLFFLLFLAVIYDNSIFAQNKEFVSLVNGIFDEKEAMVILTWEPVDNPLVSYKVYRVSEPLKGSRFIPMQAEMIKVLDYQSRQTSDVPPRSGKYYYFISTVSGNDENMVLMADQNYTVQPVEFFKPAPPAKDLKAKLMYQSSEILLKWENPKDEEEPVKEYVLYRSREAINRETAAQAEKVAIIPNNQNIFFDRIPGPGKYFYALMSVSSRGYESRQWVAGDNTLIQPVSVAAMDAKKLPDFYIDFPVSLNFQLSYEDDWIRAPHELKIPSLVFQEMYMVEEKESEKKVSESKAQELKQEKKSEPVSLKPVAADREGEAEKGVSALEVQKEIEKVNALFSDYYRNREFEEFLQTALAEEKKLKSGYALKKLLFFKAVSYFYLNRPAQAGLILKELKSDARFMKYNEKKVRFLENKIWEKQ